MTWLGATPAPKKTSTEMVSPLGKIVMTPIPTSILMLEMFTVTELTPIVTVWIARPQVMGVLILRLAPMPSIKRMRVRFVKPQITNLLQYGAKLSRTLHFL